jgi:uncharacterized coiled-coil protein SlyX
MQSMTEHLAKMEEDTRAADSRAGRLERELNEERGKAATGQSEQVARVEAGMAQSQRRIQELEKELAAREGQIGVLQQQLTGQAKRVNQLLAEVTDLRSKQLNK